jgi:hypothetical protein
LEIQQIQRQVMQLVSEAFSEVSDLQGRVDAIWSDEQRLTPEARQQDVALALAEGGTSIRRTLEEGGRGILHRAYAEVDHELAELTAVSPEELATARAEVSLALSGVEDQGDGLLNLYQQRHLSSASRRVIENAASALIDARGGSDNYSFRDSWGRLENEIAATRGPEERAVVSHRTALDELTEYLEAARSLVGMDLTLIDPSLTAQDRDDVKVRRAITEADVNRVESKYAMISPSSPAM